MTEDSLTLTESLFIKRSADLDAVCGLMRQYAGGVKHVTWSAKQTQEGFTLRVSRSNGENVCEITAPADINIKTQISHLFERFWKEFDNE